MTNQELVAALDAVINRWQRARALLASLDELASAASGLSAAPAEEERSSPVDQVSSPVEVTVTLLKPAKTRVQRPRVPRPTPARTAFAAAVPQVPVAVSAAEASRHRVRAPASAVGIAQARFVVQEPGSSLDDLVREIEQRLDRTAAS